MIVGIPRETKPGEMRVAMSPANVKFWCDKGAQVLLQSSAGTGAGYPDADYVAAGATLCPVRTTIFEKADIILQVQSFGSNNVNGDDDLPLLREGQVVAGMMDPLGSPGAAEKIAVTGATGIAMELVPRISRAQSMDVLSSMATLAGYKAVLIGAALSPRIMPMLMTAAGTLSPMRVFIMGVGVAGLQACATAKRLGGVVEAYDVRPAAREQIISVGAKPIELDLETESSEDKGGYAKAQGEDFLRRQREQMTAILAQQDLVITTAAIPGAKSPILVTAEMVAGMKPGAVIVDLAAERGGNCELTKLDETVVVNGVTIVGPDNIASSVPQHASQMYGKNMEILLGQLLDADCNLQLDFSDEIIAETVTAHGGEVRHKRLRELLGLTPRESAPAEPPANEPPATEPSPTEPQGGAS